MDLYEVKGPGLPSPLNAREISQLFRHGRLHRNVPCKPKGEANWRTVDQIFPLLKYSPEAYSFPPDERKRKRRWFALVVVLAAILFAGALYLL